MVHQIPDSFERGSVFSDDHKYRYFLFRRWDAKLPMGAFIMLNPSIANSEIDDPTQTRCRTFAQKWGWGGYSVGNLFAYVSTDPKELFKVKDPVGPKNDETLMDIHRTSDKTIVAWGKQNDMVHQRAIKVANMLRKEKEIYALATCKDGSPKHPLYLKQTLEPVLYQGYY